MNRFPAGGWRGHALGIRNEHRVLAACMLGWFPAWWLKVRSSTHLEDAMGVDMVVETTDAGVFGLQIKSSKSGARKHLCKQRKQNAHRIPVIWVRGKKEWEIHEMVLGMVSEMRAKRLRLWANEEEKFSLESSAA